MSEIKVKDFKLKIVRGRTGRTEKRFEYSTLIEFIMDEWKGEPLTIGVVPFTYFYLKKVLNEKLDDLEKVILHNIRKDDRIYLEEFLVTNNLLKINMESVLNEIVDKIVIDRIEEVGHFGYVFSASIYLNNGQRIPNVIPSDAMVLALLGKKDIFIKENIMEEKKEFEQKIEEIEAIKKEKGLKPKDEEKEQEIPKNIYT